MQRIIDAPDKEWLSEAEVAAWLGISGRAFGKLLDDNAIPRGRRLVRDEEYWPWRQVLAISILLESGYFGRLETEGTKPEGPTKREK